MSKKYFLLAAVLFGTVVSAQVKIGGTDGTPNVNAMLEIESTNKGVLFPRLALTSLSSEAPLSNHVEGMIVYNTTVDAVENLTSGLYQNDGTQWKRLIAEGDEALGGVKFFYMPSIVINTSSNGIYKRNLHAEYIAQFTGKEFLPDPVNTGGSVGPNDSPRFVKSTGGTPETTAPDEIPNTPTAADLWYYVTDYDDTALDNLSIDENGVLTYEVIGTGTDYSFINVVFVVK